eukprot:15474302-Alexandrium_andersonii.AAC.1
MEVDSPLRKEPRGLGLVDLTKDEQRWARGEKEVRSYALEHSDLWRIVPPGSGDDSEAFERF